MWAVICSSVSNWTTMEAAGVRLWIALSDSAREMCFGHSQCNGGIVSRGRPLLHWNCARVVASVQCCQGWKVDQKRTCTALPHLRL